MADIIPAPWWQVEEEARSRGLDDKAIEAAKRNYWDEFVASMEAFKQLTPVEQKARENNFFEVTISDSQTGATQPREQAFIERDLNEERAAIEQQAVSNVQAAATPTQPPVPTPTQTVPPVQVPVPTVPVPQTAPLQAAPPEAEVLRGQTQAVNYGLPPTSVSERKTKEETERLAAEFVVKPSEQEKTTEPEKNYKELIRLGVNARRTIEQVSNDPMTTPEQKEKKRYAAVSTLINSDEWEKADPSRRAQAWYAAGLTDDDYRNYTNLTRSAVDMWMGSLGDWNPAKKNVSQLESEKDDEIKRTFGTSGTTFKDPIDRIMFHQFGPQIFTRAQYSTARKMVEERVAGVVQEARLVKLAQEVPPIEKELQKAIDSGDRNKAVELWNKYQTILNTIHKNGGDEFFPNDFDFTTLENVGTVDLPEPDKQMLKTIAGVPNYSSLLDIGDVYESTTGKIIYSAITRPLKMAARMGTSLVGTAGVVGELVAPGERRGNVLTSAYESAEKWLEKKAPTLYQDTQFFGPQKSSLEQRAVEVVGSVAEQAPFMGAMILSGGAAGAGARALTTGMAASKAERIIKAAEFLGSTLVSSGLEAPDIFAAGGSPGAALTGGAVVGLLDTMSLNMMMGRFKPAYKLLRKLNDNVAIGYIQNLFGESSTEVIQEMVNVYASGGNPLDPKYLNRYGGVFLTTIFSAGGMSAFSIAAGRKEAADLKKWKESNLEAYRAHMKLAPPEVTAPANLRPDEKAPERTSKEQRKIDKWQQEHNRLAVGLGAMPVDRAVAELTDQEFDAWSISRLFQHKDPASLIAAIKQKYGASPFQAELMVIRWRNQLRSMTNRRRDDMSKAKGTERLSLRDDYKALRDGYAAFAKAATEAGFTKTEDELLNEVPDVIKEDVAEATGPPIRTEEEGAWGVTPEVRDVAEEEVTAETRTLVPPETEETGGETAAEEAAETGVPPVEEETEPIAAIQSDEATRETPIEDMSTEEALRAFALTPEEEARLDATKSPTMEEALVESGVLGEFIKDQEKELGVKRTNVGPVMTDEERKTRIEAVKTMVRNAADLLGMRPVDVLTRSGVDKTAAEKWMDMFWEETAAYLPGPRAGRPATEDRARAKSLGIGYLPFDVARTSPEKWDEAWAQYEKALMNVKNVDDFYQIMDWLDQMPTRFKMKYGIPREQATMTDAEIREARQMAGAKPEREEKEPKEEEEEEPEDLMEELQAREDRRVSEEAETERESEEFKSKKRTERHRSAPYGKFQEAAKEARRKLKEAGATKAQMSWPQPEYSPPERKTGERRAVKSEREAGKGPETMGSAAGLGRPMSKQELMEDPFYIPEETLTTKVSMEEAVNLTDESFDEWFDYNSRTDPNNVAKVLLERAKRAGKAEKSANYMFQLWHLQAKKLGETVKASRRVDDELKARKITPERQAELTNIKEQLAKQAAALKQSVGFINGRLREARLLSAEERNDREAQRKSAAEQARANTGHVFANVKREIPVDTEVGDEPGNPAPITKDTEVSLEEMHKRAQIMAGHIRIKRELEARSIEQYNMALRDAERRRGSPLTEEERANLKKLTEVKLMTDEQLAELSEKARKELSEVLKRSLANPSITLIITSDFVYSLGNDAFFDRSLDLVCIAPGQLYFAGNTEAEIQTLRKLFPDLFMFTPTVKGLAPRLAEMDYVNTIGHEMWERVMRYNPTLKLAFDKFLKGKVNLKKYYEYLKAQGYAYGSGKTWETLSDADRADVAKEFSADLFGALWDRKEFWEEVAKTNKDLAELMLSNASRWLERASTGKSDEFLNEFMTATAEARDSIRGLMAQMFGEQILKLRKVQKTVLSDMGFTELVEDLKGYLQWTEEEKQAYYDRFNKAWRNLDNETRQLVLNRAIDRRKIIAEDILDLDDIYDVINDFLMRHQELDGGVYDRFFAQLEAVARGLPARSTGVTVEKTKKMEKAGPVSKEIEETYGPTNAELLYDPKTGMFAYEIRYTGAPTFEEGGGSNEARLSRKGVLANPNNIGEQFAQFQENPETFDIDESARAFNVTFSVGGIGRITFTVGNWEDVRDIAQFLSGYRGALKEKERAEITAYLTDKQNSVSATVPTVIPMSKKKRDTQAAEARGAADAATYAKALGEETRPEVTAEEEAEAEAVQKEAAKIVAPVKKVKPGKTIPMKYSVPASGLRAGLKDKYPNGTTTAQLMNDGNRTSTTRAKFADVGDVVKIDGVDGEWEVVSVSRPDLKTPEGRAAWEEAEGWSLEYIDKNLNLRRQVYSPKSVQTILKKTGEPSAVEEEPVLPLTEEMEEAEPTDAELNAAFNGVLEDMMETAGMNDDEKLDYRRRRKIPDSMDILDFPVDKPEHFGVLLQALYDERLEAGRVLYVRRVGGKWIIERIRTLTLHMPSKTQLYKDTVMPDDEVHYQSDIERDLNRMGTDVYYILAHNHPNWVTVPSSADIESIKWTAGLRESGQYLGDIIFGKHDFLVLPHSPLMVGANEIEDIVGAHARRALVPTEAANPEAQVTQRQTPSLTVIRKKMPKVPTVIIDEDMAKAYDRAVGRNQVHFVFTRGSYQTRLMSFNTKVLYGGRDVQIIGGKRQIRTKFQAFAEANLAPAYIDSNATHLTAILMDGSLDEKNGVRELFMQGIISNYVFMDKGRRITSDDELRVNRAYRYHGEEFKVSREDQKQNLAGTGELQSTKVVYSDFSKATPLSARGPMDISVADRARILNEERAEIDAMLESPETLLPVKPARAGSNALDNWWGISRSGFGEDTHRILREENEINRALDRFFDPLIEEIKAGSGTIEEKLDYRKRGGGRAISLDQFRTVQEARSSLSKRGYVDINKLPVENIGDIYMISRLLHQEGFEVDTAYLIVRDGDKMMVRFPIHQTVRSVNHVPAIDTTEMKKAIERARKAMGEQSRDIVALVINHNHTFSGPLQTARETPNDEFDTGPFEFSGNDVRSYTQSMMSANEVLAPYVSERFGRPLPVYHTLSTNENVYFMGHRPAPSGVGEYGIEQKRLEERLSLPGLQSPIKLGAPLEGALEFDASRKWTAPIPPMYYLLPGELTSSFVYPYIGMGKATMRPGWQREYSDKMRAIMGDIGDPLGMNAKPSQDAELWLTAANRHNKTFLGTIDIDADKFLSDPDYTRFITRLAKRRFGQELYLGMASHISPDRTDEIVKYARRLMESGAIVGIMRDAYKPKVVAENPTTGDIYAYPHVSRAAELAIPTQPGLSQDKMIELIDTEAEREYELRKYKFYIDENGNIDYRKTAKATEHSVGILENGLKHKNDYIMTGPEAERAYFGHSDMELANPETLDYKRTHITPHVLDITKFQELQRALQDQYVAVKKYNKEYNPTGNEDTDPYLALELMDSQAAAEITAFRQRMVEPLQDIVERAGEVGLSLEDAERFLYMDARPEREKRLHEIYIQRRKDDLREKIRYASDQITSLQDAIRLIDRQIAGRERARSRTVTDQQKIVYSEDIGALRQQKKDLEFQLDGKFGWESRRMWLEGQLYELLEKERVHDYPTTGMTDAEYAQAQRDYASLNNEQKLAYQQIKKWTQEASDLKLGYLVKYGLISQEQADNMKAVYAHYVPLKGKMVADVHQALMEEEAFAALTGGVKMPRGPSNYTGRGENKAVDLLGTFVADIEYAIGMGVRNQSLMPLLQLALATPDHTVVTVRDTVPMERYLDKESGIAKVRPEVNYATDHERVVVVRVNGVPFYIEFGTPGRNIAVAINGTTNARSVVGILRPISFMTRTFARLYTSISPEFPITNLVRDVGSAVINLQGSGIPEFETLLGGMRYMFGQFPENLRVALQVLWNIDAGQNDPLADEFREFMQYGGMTGFVTGLKGHQMEEVLYQHNKAFNFMDKSAMEKAQLAGQAMWKWSFGLLEHMNTGIENATRFAVYRAAKAAGMSPKKAAHYAKNATVNFNRKGEWGPSIGSMYLFFNASLQGIQIAAQNIAEKPEVRKALLKLTLMGFLMNMFGRLAGGDDDWGENYMDKIPNQVRDGSAVIPLRKSGGIALKLAEHAGLAEDSFGFKAAELYEEVSEYAYFKIPLPHMYRFFWALGDTLGDVVAGKESPLGAGMRMAGNMYQSMNPLSSTPPDGLEGVIMTLMPQPLKPAVEIMVNRDWTGYPIRPPREFFGKTLMDHEMYYNTINPHIKQLTDSLWENGWTIPIGKDQRIGMPNWWKEDVELLGYSHLNGLEKFISDTLFDWSPENVEHFTKSAGGLISSIIGAVVTSQRAIEAVKTGDVEQIQHKDIPIFRRFMGFSTNKQHETDFWNHMDQAQRLKERLRVLKENGRDDMIAKIGAKYGPLIEFIQTGFDEETKTIVKGQRSVGNEKAAMDAIRYYNKRWDQYAQGGTK